jgi:tetratricopeptide (TPR) repeat protein
VRSTREVAPATLVGVTARARVAAIVALAAAAASAAIVGVTLIQTRGESTTAAGAVTKPRAGSPPLELDFGVRSDPEARALARAQTLYNNGKIAQAAPFFGRYRSLEAQIGSAFAAWTQGGGLDALKRLVASHPRSALAALHLGWAYYWAGRNADALAAWERTAKLGADSPYGVDAQDALHPTTIPGLPPIVTTLALPETEANLPAGQQLSLLKAHAARPDANAKLLYGLALWHLERPLSAERQFAAAAKLAPRDPVARTATAVGAFTKASPVRAFGRLGPLTAVFPKAAVVRFELGLLLLWTGERKKAAAQLRLAVADAPQSVYAKNARALLASLVKNGTK